MGDVRRAHRQIEATRRTLLRRGHKSDARGAEYWLRHRFLADWDLLWEERTDPELDSLRAATDLLVRAAESAAGLHPGPRRAGASCGTPSSRSSPSSAPAPR